MNGKENNTGENLMIGIVTIIITVIIFGFVLLVIGRNNKPQSDMIAEEATTEAADETSEDFVEYIDADEYFAETSRVIEIVKAEDSADVLTEAGAFDLMAERGFGDITVATEYNMAGEYSEDLEVSETSDTKHPIYYTYYISDNDEVWTITVVDGSITALPVSYNMESTREAQLIISESEIITSYDSVTNKFYKNIPDESALIVKVVDRIDAQTLNLLTVDVVDGL